METTGYRKHTDGDIEKLREYHKLALPGMGRASLSYAVISGMSPTNLCIAA